MASYVFSELLQANWLSLGRLWGFLEGNMENEKAMRGTIKTIYSGENAASEARGAWLLAVDLQ